MCVCVCVCVIWRLNLYFLGHSLGAWTIYIQVLVIDPELWGTGLWGMGGALLVTTGLWDMGYWIWDTGNGGGTGNGN